MAVAKIVTKDEYDQYLPEVKKQLGNCPACKQAAHVYTRQFPFGKAEWPSRRLDNCPQFLSKAAKERGELIEEAKGCYKCTGWSHQGETCFIKIKSNCSVIAGGKACVGSITSSSMAQGLPSVTKCMWWLLWGPMEMHSLTMTMLTVPTCLPSMLRSSLRSRLSWCTM